MMSPHFAQDTITPIRDSLDGMGLDPSKAQIGIRGSAVAGKKFVPPPEGAPRGTAGKFSGPAFGARDGGTKSSDHDLFIVSPDLLKRAEQLGIEIRGNGTRTGELTRKQLDLLGLNPPKSGKHKAGIVVYGSRDALWDRGPHMLFEMGSN
jgi:hypothetical protein